MIQLHTLYTYIYYIYENPDLSVEVGVGCFGSISYICENIDQEAMMYLITVPIIVACAILIRFRPNLVNTLSEEDRRKMDPKKIGRIGFWGMMTTAALLMVCYFARVPDIIGMFVVMPGAIITAGLIQASIK